MAIPANEARTGPANEARARRARRLTVAAAPVLCGAAAAAAVIGTPAASMAATTHVQESHAAPAHQGTRTAAHVANAAHTVKSDAAKSSTVKSYTVKSGDTLSAIAGRYYGDQGFWTAIYRANQHTIRYANEIQPGQALTIPAKPAQAPAAPAELSAPVYHSEPVQSVQSVQPTQSVQDTSAESGTAQAASADSQSAPATGGSAFQQCVVSRESGGDSQVMNSSGHYGLYQFSSSTWAAYGGNPADFGHASTAEQNQVFNNAVAQGGQSNWSAYDGC